MKKNVSERLDEMVFEVTQQLYEILDEQFGIKIAATTTSDGNTTKYFEKLISMTDKALRYGLPLGSGKIRPHMRNIYLYKMIKALEYAELFVELVDEAVVAGLHLLYCVITDDTPRERDVSDPAVVFYDEFLMRKISYSCDEEGFKDFEDYLYRRLGKAFLGRKSPILLKYGITIESWDIKHNFELHFNNRLLRDEMVSSISMIRDCYNNNWKDSIPYLLPTNSSEFTAMKDRINGFCATISKAIEQSCKTAESSES